MAEQAHFKKDLRKIDIWALALGSIIGWGCFMMPGTSFLPKAGPVGSIAGLMLGACIISIISFSYGYLIQKFPLSGGEFVYSDAAFGKTHAFICGWGLVLGYWSLIPLNSTALGLLSRYIPGSPLMIGKLYTIAGWDVYLGEVLLAYVFISFFAIINIRGVKSAGWFQTLVAVALAASVAFVLIGVCMSDQFNLDAMEPLFLSAEPLWDPASLSADKLTLASEAGVEQVPKSVFACIMAIVAYTPYCFVGFDCIPQAAEEYKFSHKAALRLMIGAILVGGLIYSAMVFVTSVVDPWQQVLAAKPGWATGDMIHKAIGGIGVFFCGIAMLCAVVSGINGFMLSSTRLIYSMSYSDALPRKFSELTKQGTPKNAIIFMWVLALIAPWFGRNALIWIVDMTCVGAGLGFVYTCCSATMLAKREGNQKQFLISLLGIAVASIFLIITFIPGMPGFLSNESWIILGVWVVIGIIFYFSIRKEYIYGRWKGISVEQILYTKMKADGRMTELSAEQAADLQKK